MKSLPAPPPVLPLLAAINAGRLTPAAALEPYVKRLAAHEPHVHAFAHVAIEAARRALPIQGARGPLRGLPVGIKDIFDTADMPTAYGTTLYAGHQPASDAAIVALARRAGASILGKTVTTPFANLDPTSCENPRAPGHTPGGSSSGSAAAVAAGMVAFAVGTQTGGSTVRPASYCGIAGYKPSFRLLPATGMKTFSWSLDTVGLFAPTVADVAFFASALSRRDLHVTDREVGALRFGLLAVPGLDLLNPVMASAYERAVAIVRAAGATVIDLGAVRALQAGWEVHATIQNFEAAQAMAYEVDRFGDAIPPLVYADLTAGAAIPVADYDAARRTARAARKAAAALFDEVDMVLQPAAPGPPPQGLGATGKALFNRLWTLTGNPAVAVPGLSDAGGLPLGMQVIGRFGDDRRTLSAAAWLGRLLG